MIADDFYGLDIIDTIRVVKHLLFSIKITLKSAE